MALSGSAAQTTRFQYNGLEQMALSTAGAPGGATVTRHYVYGLDGTLLAEADGGTGAILREFLWLPAEPQGLADEPEEDAALPLPIALVTGVNTAAPRLLKVHADHLTRPIRLTDSARATQWQAVFRPFGEPFTVSGTADPSLRFPGQYAIPNTGHAYNWHRFYDASLGRYTQPDPWRFVDGPSV